jgi:hypothetical protein
VAEARILPELDRWLGRLFDPQHIQETVEAVLAADSRLELEPDTPVVAQAKKDAANAQARLDRYVRAITAGVDPTLLVGETRRAQADLAGAKAALSAYAARTAVPRLTADTIRATLARHEALVGLLRDVAEPYERGQLYAGLGLTLTYERRGETGRMKELVRPSIWTGTPQESPRGVTPRVRGPIRTRRPRWCCAQSWCWRGDGPGRAGA